MDVYGRGVFGDDFFGFDVEALAEFAGTFFTQPAFPGDARGRLDCVAVGKGLEAGIDGRSGRASQLDVKCAGQEEGA